MTENPPKSFSFFYSYFEALQTLSDPQRLRLVDAMLEFAFCGVVPDLADDMTLQLAWSLIRPNLERSISNAKSGARGGRPRKQAEEE